MLTFGKNQLKIYYSYKDFFIFFLKYYSFLFFSKVVVKEECVILNVVTGIRKFFF